MVFPCNGRAIIAWPVSRPLPLQCEQLQDGVHDGVLIVRAGDEMGGVLGPSRPLRMAKLKSAHAISPSR
jgi:hypothetical protein